MTLSPQALRREFDHKRDHKRACPQGRARRLAGLDGLRGAAPRLFLSLLTLFAMNAPVQAEDAPLPGVARAAEVAWRHLSDPALSPASAHPVEGLLRRYELYIAETDADYRVQFRFLGTRFGMRGEKLKGLAGLSRYRVGKEDFRILEVRHNIYTGDGRSSREVFLTHQSAARENDAPLPGFLRALAVAYRDMASHLPGPGVALHIPGTGILVEERDHFYHVAFSLKPELELDMPGLETTYYLDKQDFRRQFPRKRQYDERHKDGSLTVH
ncbi:MAG: hypothetical protein LBF51_01425 [Zoogloeaceae bacterium]|jgi:hypothetical protein|nr:hypothetical protein [Zoogloeaceae bacterium]